MGLNKQYGSSDFRDFAFGPYRTKAFFYWLQKRLVRSRSTFEQKMKGLRRDSPCQFVEGAKLQNNRIVVQAPTKCREPNFMAFSQVSRAFGDDTSVLAPVNPSLEWIGLGYNILDGNPLAESSDPGFKNSPFSITTDSFDARTGTSSCRTSSSNFISTSATQAQESQATSIGLQASGGGFAKVAFTGNMAWSSKFEQSTEETAATIVGKTEVVLESRSLRPFPSLKLCPDFKQAVTQAIQGNHGDSTLQYILNAFGTHYVESVDVGGKANTIVQTSSQTLQSLKQQNLDVSASVSAGYGLYNGKATAENSYGDTKKVFQALQSSQKFRQQQPAGVDVPTLPNGEVDCGKYAQDIKASGQGAALAYHVRPLSYLFDTSITRNLWEDTMTEGNITADEIKTLGGVLDSYILNCKDRGTCKTLGSACNVGFYGTAPNCNSCFQPEDAFNKVGSPGHCHETQDCSNVDGTCIGTIPSPPPLRNSIKFGEQLEINHSLYAGSCELRFQDDGNIIMFKNGNIGNGVPGVPASLEIDGDGATRLGFSTNPYGNLVAVTPSGKVVWATKTMFYKNSDEIPQGSTLEAELQDDCNFVVYVQKPGETGRLAIWSWNSDDYSLKNGNYCKTLCSKL